MRSKCGRANQDSLRHEAHAVLKITWFSFPIHVARGVRDNWSDSTRPSSAFTVFPPAPNGWRYPLVGGTRGRRFAGTNLKPRKLPENAATPTSRVHALLGG